MEEGIRVPEAQGETIGGVGLRIDDLGLQLGREPCRVYKVQFGYVWV